MDTRVFYKAIRPNGESFHDPYFRWLPEGWQSGDPIPADWVVEHPNPGAKIGRSGARASEYLSIATVPTDCTGFEWPCVLLEVEAVGQAYLDDEYPNKRRVRAAKVLRELPAHEVFGPQGVEVAAILDRTRRLTAKEAERLAAGARDATAWDATRGAAWDAAWDATRGAAWNAAWDATRKAARGAAGAVSWDAAAATLARDLITPEQYDLLMAPWLAVVGDE